MAARTRAGRKTLGTVEVLDAAGVPFARIGPDGVAGNFAAPAWYLTYSPGAVVPAAAAPGAEPRWVRASTESNFGWASARASGRRADAATDARTATEWRRVATAPRFSWIEPRAQGPSAAPVGPGAATSFAWEVPMQIGADRVLVTGQAVWKTVE